VSFSILIPARLASTRLPDKPLADIAGLPMVVRWRSARRCRARAKSWWRPTTAASSPPASATALRALLTRTDHASGSDRLAEACELLGLDGAETVVNVQGDEPLIEPALIDACAALLEAHADCAMSTAAHPITSVADYLNPNVVKVVLDRAGRALLFSRAPLPWWRDGPAAAGLSGLAGVTALPDPPPLRHVGLYGYRAAFPAPLSDPAMAPLERIEALGAICACCGMANASQVHVTAEAPGAGVDTPADLERVRALFAS